MLDLRQPAAPVARFIVHQGRTIEPIPRQFSLEQLGKHYEDPLRIKI
jgi:hypothetical protein